MKHFSCILQLIATVVAGVILISGCSSNPYVRTPGLVISLPTTSFTTASQFAGDLEQAIKDVDAQRLAYYDELKTRTVQRNLLSGSLIGLSAGALYKGITSAAGSGSRAVVNFGATAGGAYALGNYSNSPNTELAYITAANDLTCLVLRTRPWLLTKDEFGTFTTSVSHLLSTTDALDALFQQQVAQSDYPKAFLRDHSFEKKILYKARITYRKASNFKGFVDTAGFQLRQDAVLASNVANFEIHRLQPELVNPSTALTGLRNTSQAFRDIKPLDVAPAEEQEEESGKSGKSDDTSKPPPEDTTVKTGTTTQSTPEASPTAASDSGKAADKLEKQVAEQAKLLAAQEKANDKRAQQTAAKLKDLTAELKSLTYVVTALNASKTATLNVVSKLDVTDRKALAKALSDVLAAMRPVNAVLTRAFSLKPYVKSIPQCQPLNAQAFEFAFEPGEVTLAPGQSFDVAVKGGVGVPQIWLSGAKGDSKGEMPKFTTSIDGGIARAKLILLATTPPGEMHIMAVDGSGKQRDDVKVIVELSGNK